MKLLKTFIDSSQQYLECEYTNKYPTYYLNYKVLDLWSTGMTEDFRTYIPIGYIRENT